MHRVLLPAVLLLLGAPAEAARLVVTIDGVHSAAGSVLVALYAKPDGFSDGDYSYRHTRVTAATTPITVVTASAPSSRARGFRLTASW